MRLSRLILCGLLALATAATADAGPLARLLGRGRCGGCQPAHYAPPVQYQPPVPMPQQGTVHMTSYVRTADPGPVATGYPAIQLGCPLPTCGPQGCWR